MDGQDFLVVSVLTCFLESRAINACARTYVTAGEVKSK
jgi:hypothetical protein